jgi:hypothetical protein
MRRLLLLVLLTLLLGAPIAAHAQLGDVLTIGTPASGSITAETLERRYIFEAAAGEIISASMTATTEGLDTYLTLIAPDGVPVSFDDDSGGNRNSLLGPIRLQATGAYVLAASSCCPGSTEPSLGDYSIVVNRVTTQALTLGTPAAFELTANESLAVFTLDVPAAQLVRFDLSGLQGSGNILLTAIDTQGNVRAVDTRSTDPGSVFYPTPPAYAPQGDSYLVTLRRDLNTTTDSAGVAFTGVTSGTLAAQSIALTPYTLGSPQSGTLDDATPYLAYSFAGDASALLALTGGVPAGSGDFELLLYAPDGSINYSASTAFAETDSFNIDPIQLLGSGTYAIFIQRTNSTGASVAGTSSAYSFTLGGSAVSTLVAGQAISGSVDTMMLERTYRLDGTAGQRLRFTITPGGESFAPSVYIQGPELISAQGDGPNMGAPVFNASMSSAVSASFSYEVTLPVSGIYLVRVSNGVFSATGPVAGDFTLLMEAVGG